MGQEGGAGAKVRFWVIEAGADAKLSRESVQEIKLVLTPVDTQAAPGPVAGCRHAVLIEGGAVDGED